MQDVMLQKRSLSEFNHLITQVLPDCSINRAKEYVPIPQLSAHLGDIPGILLSTLLL